MNLQVGDRVNVQEGIWWPRSWGLSGVVRQASNLSGRYYVVADSGNNGSWIDSYLLSPVASDAGLDAIHEARRNRKGGDSFEDGTVIRWTASGRYSYAALKTQKGWFTTAREYNSFVKQSVTWAELLEILAKAETTDVLVSDTWKTVE